MHRTPTKFVATKKAALDLAAKSTSFSLMEALYIMSKFINSSSLDDRMEISNCMEVCFQDGLEVRKYILRLCGSPVRLVHT